MKRLREFLIGMPAGDTFSSGDMEGLQTILLCHQTAASSDGYTNDA